MRILLCEDKKQLSNALVKILKHYNYSVDAVYDGEEALAFIDAENYDDVLDYMGGEVYDSKEMFWFVHKVSDIINSTIKNNIELISFDEYNLCNDYLDEELNSKLPTRDLMVSVKR